MLVSILYSFYHCNYFYIQSHRCWFEKIMALVKLTTIEKIINIIKAARVSSQLQKWLQGILANHQQQQGLSFLQWIGSILCIFYIVMVYCCLGVGERGQFHPLTILWRAVDRISSVAAVRLWAQEPPWAVTHRPAGLYTDSYNGWVIHSQAALTLNVTS